LIVPQVAKFAAEEKKRDSQGREDTQKQAFRRQYN